MLKNQSLNNFTDDRRCGTCKYFSKYNCTRIKVHFPSDETDRDCGKWEKK